MNKREAAHTKTGARNGLKYISKITTRGAKSTRKRQDCVSTGQKLEMVRKPVKHFFRFVVAMESNYFPVFISRAKTEAHTKRRSMN